MIKTKNRPKYLNLLKIRLPVTGVASICHRISGALLFLSLPFFVYLFGESLQGDIAFNQVSEILMRPEVKLLLIILFWSIAHHFFAGIRFLLLDMGIGSELQKARVSARLVILLGLLSTVFFIIRIW